MHETHSRRDLARRLLVPQRRTTASALLPTAPPSVMSFEQHLLSRATFGPSPATLLELERMGLDAWLEQQLDPASIDDEDAEMVALEAIEPWQSSASGLRLLARALWSKRQLAWRMVHFLNNHFATYRGSTVGISETKEDDAFYQVCFGNFATVLRTSATSPAMIDFLDSRSNVAGRPNENYARELMELHTLGVTGGYTEPDVAQAARVFTGWSRTNVVAPGTTTNVNSYFRFVPGSHDSGPKSLTLGWSTPGISGANGYLEGYSLLDFLAAHANTATFFTTKLCAYFVADQPTPGLLQRVRQTFVATNGNLQQTVRAIFLDPDFADPAHLRTKVHDGFEMVVSMLRRLELPYVRLSTVHSRIGQLRSQPHEYQVPTGLPELGPAWQGAGNLLPRWDFADDLVNNRISQTTVPWTTIFPTLPASGAGYVSTLLARLVDGDVPATTTQALVLFMNNRLAALPGNPTMTQVLPHLRALASLVLRLPEAQLH